MKKASEWLAGEEMWDNASETLKGALQIRNLGLGCFPNN